jgi:hypothetical protein
LSKWPALRLASTARFGGEYAIEAFHAQFRREAARAYDLVEEQAVHRFLREILAIPVDYSNNLRQCMCPRSAATAVLMMGIAWLDI